MVNVEIEKLKEELKQDEGYVEKIYRDSLGFLTCGWGHHLYLGSRINQTIAEEFLKMDIADAISDYYRFQKATGVKLDPRRARVIINMLFNMGLPKVLGFKNMIKALKDKNYEKAAREMINSKWAIQVGDRAKRLANLMQDPTVRNKIK